MKNLVFFLTFLALTSDAFGAVNLTIPDKEGMTIKGVVYCGDEPVAGVQVSDGINFAYTDAEGKYYLASKKECGHVFICNPKGYRYVVKDQYPDFYRTISPGQPDVVEQADFELRKETGKDYTVLMLADLQMCGRNNDISQYERYVVPDINKTIKDYKNNGNEVFIITLGDQSYNTYWSLKGIGIPEIKKYMNRLTPDAIFNCPGNHDNIPDQAGDWAVSSIYRENWGPTYYSFNLGDTHYVVLDNIEFSETSADNSYECNITSRIIKWFRKDISKISKDTPLVICMHAPLFARPQCSKPGIPDAIKYRYDFGTTFGNSVADFTDVRVFTGHAHTNYTVIKGKITEYNVGAPGGNLWWTGYFTGDNRVCTDGTPGGYRILDYKDGEMVTYYKSIGYNRDYQFRAYDLNQTHITAARFAPNYKNPADIEKWISEGKFGYGNDNYNSDGTAKDPNRILINVFGYDTRWNVEVIENGTPLEVTRISGYDPYAMISDGCMRFEKVGRNSSSPTKNSHLFIAKASSATSPLTINVTDEYGNVFTETMVRPKKFSFDSYLNENGKSGIVSVQGNDYGMTPEYFTLTGMRIAKPDKGIFIMRQGTKVSKILIR